MDSDRNRARKIRSADHDRNLIALRNAAPENDELRGFDALQRHTRSGNDRKIRFRRRCVIERVGGESRAAVKTGISGLDDETNEGRKKQCRTRQPLKNLALSA